MPSENNDNKNKYEDGNPGEPGNPIYDEKKEKLVAQFRNEILPIKNVGKFKKALSGFLFNEAAHESIHGVGISMSGKKKCVRIYFDDHKADQARDALQTFMDLSKIPETLPDKMPEEAYSLTLETGVIVQLVRAPQPVLSAFASGSTALSKEDGEAASQLDLNRSGPQRISATALQQPCNATREYTSLPAGTSIWRKFAAKGTIGYFCEDSEGNKYVLSCNHVLADLADGNDLPAERTLYRDGSGSSIMSLATLAEFVALSETTPNLVDAALAEISSRIQNRIIEGVKITGTKAARVGQEVEKHGLATCKTQGIVDDISCDMRVNGPNGKTYHFIRQIRIKSVDSRPFADKGDSGSLVFERDVDPKHDPSKIETGAAVGLLFARGNRNYLPDGLEANVDRTVDYVLVNPIETVIGELKKRLRTRLGERGLTLALAGTLPVS
jgi:hypothetical protein